MLLIQNYTKDLEFLLSQYDNNKKAFEFLIEKNAELIVHTTHSCEYKEFGMILEDRLINALVPFVGFLKREGRSDYVLGLFEEFKRRLKECHKKLKEMHHIIRYNIYKKKIGWRYKKE